VNFSRHFFGQLYVFLMAGHIATHQEPENLITQLSVVQPVTRPHKNPHLGDAIPNRLMIPEITPDLCALNSFKVVA
jgi:hypothetical protein